MQRSTGTLQLRVRSPSHLQGAQPLQPRRGQRRERSVVDCQRVQAAAQVQQAVRQRGCVAAADAQLAQAAAAVGCQLAQHARERARGRRGHLAAGERRPGERQWLLACCALCCCCCWLRLRGAAAAGAVGGAPGREDVHAGDG